jgi:tetratricopeptide (TPR) repeat protein
VTLYTCINRWAIAAITIGALAMPGSAFYRSALRSDPKNNELLDRAFISSLAEGDIDEAVKLADRILTQDKANRVARLVVGVRDLKQKKYATAQLNINQSIRGPITDLVATLLSGWASFGAGDSKAAVADLQGPAYRHDPRTRQPRERCRQPARALLQAR